jgi:hypothetical protein
VSVDVAHREEVFTKSKPVDHVPFAVVDVPRPDVSEIPLIQLWRIAAKARQSLLAVTEGFVAYTAAMVDVVPSLLADFTAIAARLLVLKSRSLLPAPPKMEDESEPDDLARQLIAYQAVRDGASALRTREVAGLRSWGRDHPLADLPRAERPGDVADCAAGSAG